MFYEMIGFVANDHADPDAGTPPSLDLSRASVFVDFDGTLVDLADRPDAIAVDPGLPDLLARLAATCGGRVVIVTGRAVADLDRWLPGFDGPVIGGHGAETRRQDKLIRHPLADAPQTARIARMVADFAGNHPGLLAEPKPTGVVLHFREAPDHAARAYTFLRAIAETHDGFELHHSKMAYELRPDGIGKDHAIAAMMREDGFRGTMPVFLGDDVTDEPALAWVAAQGGVAVKVGEGDTAAGLRLADPAAARRLLERWGAGTGAADAPATTELPDA